MICGCTAQPCVCGGRISYAERELNTKESTYVIEHLLRLAESATRIVSPSEDLVTANGWEGSESSVKETQPHIYYRMLALREALDSYRETTRN